MKDTFEKRLRDYGEVAKDQIEKNDLDKELETVYKWHMRKGAEASRTDLRTQVDIYNLQLNKQEIIAELKKNIAELDSKEIHEEKNSGNQIVKVSESFVLKDSREPITLGEIITDGEWNLDYSLNSESIPRNIRKRYLIERSKIKLQRLLDDQIAINEMQSENVHYMKRDAYKNSFKEKESEKSGLLAEKMIRNLLKKVSIDLDGDFEIIKADLYQDVNQKVDFIIRRNIKERGVKIEENKKNTGFQFTINTAEDVIKHKTEQIERAKRGLQPGDNIQDIVLVSVPIFDIQQKYRDWKKDKKPGGPDKLWSSEDKIRIFSQIMKDFLSAEEIKEYSGKIK